MRILFISRTLPYLGGREIIVDRLINYFKKHDYVAVITPDRWVKDSDIQFVNSNQNIKQIEKRVSKLKPQIINCHTFYFADIAIYLSKKFKIPLVFTLHGVFLKFYGKDYRSIIQKICVNSNYVSVVSKNYQTQLISFLKRKEKRKIVLIRNGISTNVNVNSLKFHTIRRKYKLPINRRIVIVPVRMNKIKGAEYVISAAKQINRDDILFLVSSPKGRKNNQEKVFKTKLIRSLDIIKHLVRFRNFSHHELQEILPSCDMCLIPSLTEGISLSILESMMAGLIVVATRVGGNPEIIQSGRNGFLIKSKNRKEIITTVCRVLDLSTKEKKRIIKEARKTVIANFSERKMLQLYRQLFLRAIFTYENK